MILDLQSPLVVVALWLAVVFTTIFLAARSGDPILRRRLWRYGSIALVLGAVAYVAARAPAGAPPWLLLVLAPVWIWFSLKVGRFCSACGRLQVRFQVAPWQSIRPGPDCNRCGAKVDGPT